MLQSVSGFHWRWEMHVGRPMAVALILVGQLRDGTGTSVVGLGVLGIGEG